MMKMFEDWEFEDTWTALAIVIVIALVITGEVFVFAPKNVDYYYVSHGGQGNSQSAACVYSHWTWHVDEVAFCTDDVAKAQDFMLKANQDLKRK